MKYAFDISARSLLNMDVDDVLEELEGPVRNILLVYERYTG